MADLALNEEGDLLLTDNSLAVVEGDDAIVQHLAIRLQFFLGEWFLDTRLGVPYFNQVLIKNPNLVVVRGLFRQVILTTPGVDTIEEFELDFDQAARKLTVTFTVRKSTDGGLLDFSREFIIA